MLGISVDLQKLLEPLIRCGTTSTRLGTDVMQAHVRHARYCAAVGSASTQSVQGRAVALPDGRHRRVL